jgi:hypothetical protein
MPLVFTADLVLQFIGRYVLRVAERSQTGSVSTYRILPIG